MQVWESVLCLPIEPEGLAGDLVQPLVSSCVHITGGWEGSVVVRCSRDLAASITETMFGMDPGEASADEIADAIGEIANMIGGNVKSLVPGPSQLSLPVVADGGELVFPESEACAESNFVTSEQPMMVSVLRRSSGTHAPTSPGVS
jgi:chemotaxis protein CheX